MIHHKLEKVKRPFPRISYNEAVELLKSKGNDFEWGNDFGAPDETIISEQYDKPVMIHQISGRNKSVLYEKRS